MNGNDSKYPRLDQRRAGQSTERTQDNLDPFEQLDCMSVLVRKFVRANEVITNSPFVDMFVPMYS